MQSRKLTTPLLFAVLLTLSVVATASSFNNSIGRDNDTLSGKYEGVAKSDQMGEIPLTVQIKNDNGKLTGSIETPQGPAAITGGTFDGGKIVMKFDAGGNEGTVTAMLDGDKISGKWELGGQGGGLELKRAAMVAERSGKLSRRGRAPGSSRSRRRPYLRRVGGCGRRKRHPVSLYAQAQAPGRQGHRFIRIRPGLGGSKQGFPGWGQADLYAGYAQRRDRFYGDRQRRKDYRRF